MSDRLNGKPYRGPSQDALDAAKEIDHLDGQADESRWVIGDDMVAKFGPAPEHGVHDGSAKEIAGYLLQLNEAAGTAYSATSAKQWRTTASSWPVELRDQRRAWAVHMTLNAVPVEEKAKSLRESRTRAQARKIARTFRKPPPKKTPEERVLAAMQKLIDELDRGSGNTEPSQNYMNHLTALHAALGQALKKNKGNAK